GGARAEPRAAPDQAGEPDAAMPGAALGPETFEDVVALVRERRDIALVHALERTVRLVRFEPGRLEIAPLAAAPAGLAGDLGRKLTEWTGARWIVTVSGEAGAATLHEQRQAERARQVSDARADLAVSAILAEFPGAEIVD